MRQLIPNDVELNYVVPATEAATTGGSSETGLVMLTPQQRTAVEWLTAGESAADAGVAAGVSRATVYRWLKEDPNFQAAYNAWQADVTATVKAQLLAAAGVAVKAVVGSMAKGDAKTAMALLKQLGMLKPSKPGLTDPEQVAEAQRNDRLRENVRRMEDEDAALVGQPPPRRRR